MMKRFSMLMLVMLLGVASLWARPGYTKPVDVLQPDGTTVTLLMHGDEFLNFMTTTDGYTVVKGDDGFYRYADRQADGRLTASSVIARNPAVRSAAEVQFLSARQKMTAPAMTPAQRELKERAASLYTAYPVAAEDGASRRTVSIWSRINYANFKGLVVLVNLSDVQFSMADPVAFYQKLTSEANYTDATHEHYPVDVEGSVRDYFRDNSLGVFDPTFDVVGPVTYNKNANQMHNANMMTVIDNIMDQLDSSIDFSQYDLDNNGVIDMVYFIFAGYGSYVQGNDDGYLWPHASDLSGVSSWYGMRYDGKKFGRYACSVEFQDVESQKALHQFYDGIGTMCHEFGHVLGLADHYDTDYEEGGGESNHPDEWDIMAGGADQNYGLTPVGYSAFERHILGFVEPVELTESGSYTLDNFATENEAYILHTGTTNDDFYLENRQKTGWDRFLPGHGLVVWRAETTSSSVWTSNKVNVNPAHNYLEVLGMTSFPGTGSIIDLTSETTPALKSWAGKAAVQDLFDITETDGIITFKAGKNLYTTVVEDFEQADLVSTDANGVKGVFCNWDLQNAQIASVADEGVGNDAHVAKLLRSGTLTSSTAFEKGIRTLKFTVKATDKQIRIGFRISTDGGTTWKFHGMNSATTIRANKEQEFTLQNIPAGSKIQLQMTATTTTAVCYVDDIKATFFDNDIPSPNPTAIHSLTVDREQTDATYDLQGRRVTEAYRGIVIRGGKKYVVK